MERRSSAARDAPRGRRPVYATPLNPSRTPRRPSISPAHCGKKTKHAAPNRKGPQLEREMARQLPTTNAQDPLHRSRQARLRLASEGELPLGVLRDEIDASWRRSLGHGLDCLQGEQLGTTLAQRHDLRQLLEHNRLLVDAVTPELDYLSRAKARPASSSSAMPRPTCWPSRGRPRSSTVKACATCTLVVAGASHCAVPMPSAPL